MRLVAVAVLLGTTTLAQASDSGLARLDFMVGQWRGTSSGESGEGIVERTCTRVLNDRFIECRTTTTYAKEVHGERAFYSYDKVTKTLRLRQFHGEGFVNTYAQTTALAFETTSIENIPAGWRARESYEQPSADVWKERFELAEPGKDFTLYSASTLQRVK